MLPLSTCSQMRMSYHLSTASLVTSLHNIYGPMPRTSWKRKLIQSCSSHLCSPQSPSLVLSFIPAAFVLTLCIASSSFWQFPKSPHLFNNKHGWLFNVWTQQGQNLPEIEGSGMMLLSNESENRSTAVQTKPKEKQLQPSQFHLKNIPSQTQSLTARQPFTRAMGHMQINR